MPSIASSSRRPQVHSSRVAATPSRTPASSRHGRNQNNPSNNNNGDRRRPSTPEYEPLCTPLNAAGQRALAVLLSASSFQQMKKHLNQAGERVTEIAAEVNERATDSRVRHENSMRKKRGVRNKKKASAAAASRRGNGEGEEGTDDEGQDDDDEMKEDEDEGEDEEEEDDVDISRARKLEQLEDKVKEVTVQLEEKMRGIVDGDYKLNAMREVIEDVQKTAEQAGAEANARERQSRLRSRRHIDVDEDEEMEDPDMEEDGDEEETVTVVPTQVINDKLNEFDANWEEQSLAQRYTQNNSYVGFYRIVHDSKHPGDEIPPVPHPSTWFSHLESTTGADGSASPVHGRIRDDQSPDDEDEEISIERERISLKCPLTFSTFEDPVKSTKCVHSFERQAIEDLIRNSTMTIAAGEHDFQGGGRGARARRVRAVRCPVCSVTLTLNDLKRDPVLLRRVLRAKAAEQREEEEARFEGRHHHHRKGGRKSGFTIASDDDDQVSIDDDDDKENEDEDDQEGAKNRVHIKRERSRFSSRAPHSVDEIEDD
ncbi:hypothetical protein PISL3812_01398 [Talaromyces islandicus]|uniref:SP-RING-type domain-containing protein n=1 Tax=Talaromyces islandicus TaxID=28573 RepID=A0A0U1LMM8_TALIS|nr:hypothetical protein PISL3812_01398 [Talaromyces islandicus]